MDKKINNKRIFFLIIVIIICIITRSFFLGIIIIALAINGLKNRNRSRGNGKTGTAESNNYYDRPPVAPKQGKKKIYSINSAKTEEERQREKWAKRRDKDPWEWDE